MPKAWRAGALPVGIAVALVVFCIPACPQPISEVDRLSAGELLRRVVDQELRAQANDHSHWMYQVRTGLSGKEEVRLVVQTDQGNLDRLQSVNGQPITPEQEKREDQRIESLIHSPEKQKEVRRAQEEDARRTESLLHVLPNAVSANYGERRGDLAVVYCERSSKSPSNSLK